ncbi:low specificity L-threonine aldolase [Caldibacillus lycopersici]|uniref:Low specificity L-threonine aldolase n=1 Tax=Perspicuibacillus lycopersici TaxID=1325689 RepID=A0AAE3LRR7_9BACI|nr:low specificity L-threonine aldolase [Perspicuibacillus lycopersici]MCU9614964.1 low specificity L-threonine aldolase [Perspicuibacillus lycopersici]
MYSFKNDYSEGAHPSILQALVETNLVQENGYGEDQYSVKAIELIKQSVRNSNVAVHLLTGGTQTNLVAIAAFLRPHEAAISATSGHIFTHETGSIEATGHKVISIDTVDGKLTPAHVQAVLEAHEDEHMVKPKLVYISNSTEIGTLYRKQELMELKQFCEAHHLFLFMDGARLGSALCSEENDVSLHDLPSLVDAFYIGGTKNGALIGEALVICRDHLKEDFRFYMKQRGALLAKGRLLGIQFMELFKDNLFFELATHANTMAAKLKRGLREANLSFLTESSTNQIFPILPNDTIVELQKNYAFLVWGKVDETHSSIRLVTSWATKEETVTAFLEDLKKLVK